MSMLIVYLASFLQLVAESFPVSSSGHLALLDKMWTRFMVNNPEQQLSFPWADATFWERYVDFLHIVPLVIIAWYFYPRWRVFLLHPLCTWRMAARLVAYAALADCVTALLYFTRAQLPLFNIPLWIGFSVTALLLFSLLLLPTGKSVRLTWWRAVLIGLFQGLALLPGLSRFAATFCGARFLGFSSRASFEVSFMLQWPLILAAVMRSAFFLVHHTVGVVVTPTFGVILFVSSVLAWLGFCVAARLAHTERLWYCALYVVVVACVAAVCGC